VIISFLRHADSSHCASDVSHCARVAVDELSCPSRDRIIFWLEIRSEFRAGESYLGGG